MTSASRVASRHLADLNTKRTSSGVGIGTMKDKEQKTFHAEGVYVHVWFESDEARTGYGRPEPDSGDWEIIVTTSPDPLNLKPRGQELARKTFRYAEPLYRIHVLGSAEDFIRNSFFRFRSRTAK